MRAHPGGEGSQDTSLQGSKQVPMGFSHALETAVDDPAAVCLLREREEGNQQGCGHRLGAQAKSEWVHSALLIPWLLERLCAELRPTLEERPNKGWQRPGWPGMRACVWGHGTGGQYGAAASNLWAILGKKGLALVPV